MVWINDKGYDAKSYPVEARGGAICRSSKRLKEQEEKIRIAARLARRRHGSENPITLINEDKEA